MTESHLDDQALLRYSRQIMLTEVGAEGQLRLASSTVLMVGLGGLGCAAATYLASAGVGRLLLFDSDRVDLSNLQRQSLFATDDIGQFKVAAGKRRLQAINPLIHIEAIAEAMDRDTLDQWLPRAEVVIDGSDNFATRQAVNKACLDHQRPLVSAGVIAARGEISVYPMDGTSACYACLYGDDPQDPDQSCADQGVLAPLPGILGAMQALEAIKLITQLGQPLRGRLLRFDGWSGSWTSSGLTRDDDCPVCSNRCT